MSGTTSAAQQQAALQQQNMYARQLISAQALPMVQQIYSQTVTPSTSPVLNISPRNVGLLKGFWIEVTGAMFAANGTATLTKFGPANMLSQVTFTDLNNNVRHQTAGWHLAMVDAVRKEYPFPYGFTTGNPIGFGNAYVGGVISAPATLPNAAPASNNVRMLYYLPISYTPDDLRGSIYMGVTNATANLQLTLNATGFAAAAGDATLAVYGGAAGTWSTATVTVYQDYYDQLPQAQGGSPILPLIDLSTVYELKNTSLTGITSGQDFTIPYANFRSFLSTFFIFDQAGTLNAGTDINYIALQAANFTNMIKVDPFLFTQFARDKLKCDLPGGVYYMDHRRRPLNTNQYGNLELVVNPSTAAAGSTMLVGFEDFALVNTIQLSGSLPSS